MWARAGGAGHWRGREFRARDACFSDPFRITVKTSEFLDLPNTQQDFYPGNYLGFYGLR